MNIKIRNFVFDIMDDDVLEKIRLSLLKYIAFVKKYNNNALKNLQPEYEYLNQISEDDEHIQTYRKNRNVPDIIVDIIENKYK